MGLKFLQSKAYTSLKAVMTDIYRELVSLTPQDTSDIKWVRDGNGIKAYYKRIPGGGGGSDSDVSTPLGGGDSAYNGYFTINNISTETEKKIAVCDGATWDGTTSGTSTCKVNNVTFSVAVSEFVITVTKLVCLKFTATSVVDGATVPAKVECVLLDSLPSDTSEFCYYQIGRAIVSDNVMSITQDHQCGAGNGVAQLWWLTFGCADG